MDFSSLVDKISSLGMSSHTLILSMSVVVALVAVRLLSWQGPKEDKVKKKQHI